MEINMSNSKIKSEWGTDCYGQRCLILQKKRGSISQQELADHLRYELKEFGIYISILNAAESTCGVGWPEEDSHGDAVVLYLYENEGSCPVCAHSVKESTRLPADWQTKRPCIQ